MTKEEFLELLKDKATPTLVSLALDVGIDESASAEHRARCVLSAVVMTLESKEALDVATMNSMGRSLDVLCKMIGWLDEYKFWEAIIAHVDRKKAAASPTVPPSDTTGQTFH